MNIPEPTNLSPCVDKSYIPVDVIDSSSNILQGLKFKRNVYGLSIWTKTVKNVHIVWQMQTIENILTMIPEIWVESLEPSPYPMFPLKEIIFLNW